MFGAVRDPKIPTVVHVESVRPEKLGRIVIQDDRSRVSLVVTRTIPEGDRVMRVVRRGLLDGRDEKRKEK